jgi:biopolymer transport protein ExbD
MAEISNEGGGGHGKQKKGRGKKSSTKVDMTAMVDMAFLLITFFMLTTTMSKPKTMELNMPDKTDNKEDKIKVKESETITLVLDSKNKVYWYQGIISEESTPEVNEADFSPGDKGIRNVILKKKKDIGTKKTKDGKVEYAIIVVIKAQDGSNYKNMVDILDEMHICDIQKYALVDLSEVERNLVDGYKLEKKGGA